MIITSTRTGAIDYHEQEMIRPYKRGTMKFDLKGF